MILDTLAAASRQRAAELINKYGLNALRREAEALPKANRGFAKALKQKGISFICEVKKASPSKGLIAKEFNPVQQAKEYEAAGAAVISCLTEPNYFLGSNEYLTQITKNVSLPVLRKDLPGADLRSKNHRRGRRAFNNGAAGRRRTERIHCHS